MRRRGYHHCSVPGTEEAELAAAKAEAATLRQSLARHLADANDRAADAEAAAERLMQRATEVVKVVEAHQNLEREFHAALVLLQEQDADHAATTQRLAVREAELAKASETRLSLERQLAEAESALGEAVRRSADDRSNATQQAAQRQSEFEAILREEVAKHDTLAQDLLATRFRQLAHVDTTFFHDAEARHALTMTTAAAHRNQQEARHEAEMAEAAAARDAVSRQLHEATAALDGAHQDHLAHATAAANRFAQQEAMLREGTAARQMLEGQLAGAHTALEAAEESAAAERLAGRQRAAERDRRIRGPTRSEAAARQTLEQALTGSRNNVAETETALRDAEHRHASHMTMVTGRFARQAGPV